VSAIEGQPNRESQKIAQRQRGLVEGATQRLCHVTGQGRLRPLEALESVVELRPCFLVIVRQLVSDSL
jgi:hypothetical protein